MTLEFKVDCTKYTCLACGGHGCKHCNEKGFYTRAISINEGYTNHKHTGRRLLTASARSWKKHITETVFFEVLQGKQLNIPEPEHFGLNFQWTFPDKRKRDPDNYAKFVKDSLTGLIYEDDNQVYTERYDKRIVKGVWGLTVKVETI